LGDGAGKTSSVKSVGRREYASWAGRIREEQILEPGAKGREGTRDEQSWGEASREISIIMYVI